MAIRSETRKCGASVGKPASSRCVTVGVLISLTLAFIFGSDSLQASSRRVHELMDEVALAGEREPVDEVEAAELVAQLCNLPPAAAFDVLPFLGHEQRAVRLAAIKALARFKEPRTFDVLFEMFEHPDLKTALAALNEVAANAVPGGATALRALVRRVSPQPAPPEIRAAAIRSLPLAEDPATRDFLLSLLSPLPDPSLVGAIVYGLGREGDPELIEHVVPLLDLSEYRAAALMNLAPFRGAAVTLLLEETRNPELTSEGRRQIVDATLALGSSGIPVLRALLDHRDRAVTLRILHGLGEMADREAVRPLLLEYLDHAETEYVQAVIPQLGRDRAREAVPGLARRLEHPQASVRIMAAQALGEISDLSAMRPLGLALSREQGRSPAPDQEVLERIVWALGQMRSREAVPLLVGALSQERLVPTAIEALVETGLPAVRTLALILKSGDRERERHALQALLRIGVLPGREVADLVAHPDRRIRLLALDLIAAVADASAVPLLLEMAVDEENPHRRDALEVMGRFYSSDLRPVFAKLLDSEDTELAKFAIKTLWRHGDAEAGALLKGVIEEDDSPTKRAAAVRGLYFLGGEETGALFERLLQYERISVRRAAIEALGLMAEPWRMPALERARGESARELQPHIELALRRLMRAQETEGESLDTRGWYRANERRLRKRERPVAREGDGISRVVTDDGQALAYFRSGRSRNPTVVLIPDGPDGDSALLRNGLARLSRRFDVLSYDPRGRGMSLGERPFDDFSLMREALDVEVLRRAVGKKEVALVGHGYGALVAIRYAASFPENTSSVVLLNPPYLDGSGLGERDELIERRLAGDLRGAFRWVVGHAGGYSGDALGRRYAYYAWPAFFVNPEAALEHEPPRFDPLLRQSVLEQLSEIDLVEPFVFSSAPVLILHPCPKEFGGLRDKRYDRVVELTRGRVQTRSKVGTGPYGFLEDPRWFVRQVSDFLRGRE